MNLSSGGSNGSEGPKETEQGHAMELAYNILPEWRGKGLGGEVIGVLIEAWVLQTSLTAVMAVCRSFDGSHFAQADKLRRLKHLTLLLARCSVQEGSSGSRLTWCSGRKTRGEGRGRCLNGNWS